MRLLKANILLLDSSDDELEELEEVLSVDHVSVLLDNIKLLLLQQLLDVVVVKFLGVFYFRLISVGLPDEGGCEESSSSS